MGQLDFQNFDLQCEVSGSKTELSFSNCKYWDDKSKSWVKREDEVKNVTGTSSKKPIYLSYGPFVAPGEKIKAQIDLRKTLSNQNKSDQLATKLKLEASERLKLLQSKNEYEIACVKAGADVSCRCPNGIIINPWSQDCFTAEGAPRLRQHDQNKDL